MTPYGLTPRPLITTDAAGTILGVDTWSNVDAHYGTEFYSGILIPGMVNAHTHLELSYLKGLITPGGGFTAFADGLGAVRECVPESGRIAAAEYRDARMYAEGISAVGDISNSAFTFGLKTLSRIHYHTFIELYGLNADIGRGALPVMEQAVRGGLAATITPHSVYSLNEAAFLDAVGGDDNSPLSIHFMESPEEEQLFRGVGAMAEWYRGRGMQTDFTGNYDSPADRITACVPASRKVMLVHDTCAGREDIEKLQAHFGGNLTWVLCPRSNRYITGGRPPVDLLRRAGARIAVGTDSLASNTSLSLIEELKELGCVPLEETLTWATSNGAAALGAGRRYGSLEPGKQPGIILLEGADLEHMELREESSTRRLV